MSATKVCRSCSLAKPIDFFHRNCRMVDGRLNYCAKCVRQQARSVRDRDLPKARVTARETRERNKVAINAGYREWRRSHRDKRAAHRTIYKAVRRGTLIRKPCEVCGDTKSEAHHSNYSQRLNVRWLCRRHHMQLHREMREVA